MVKLRAAALMGVIRSAAPTDPDIAALWSRIQSDFYDNQRAIVEALHAKRRCGPASMSTRATDILWTLNHPDVWQLLVGERGWTPERVRAVVRRHDLRAAPDTRRTRTTARHGATTDPSPQG